MAFNKVIYYHNIEKFFMSKFKFLKISKFKKLRFLSINQNSNLYIVFLHGFMSDIEGEKPKNFYKFCKKIKLVF